MTPSSGKEKVIESSSAKLPSERICELAREHMKKRFLSTAEAFSFSIIDYLDEIAKGDSNVK